MCARAFPRVNVVPVLLALMLTTPGFPATAPCGVVMQPDPQLTETWWTSMAVRDGVRERDEVAFSRNGAKIADGLVVSVQSDHSSVMLKGNAVPTLEKGDAVVLVRHAPPVPQRAAPQAPQALGYKVVGGHSAISVNQIPVSSSEPMGGNDLGVGTGLSFPGLSFSSPLSFSSSLGIHDLGLPQGLNLDTSLGSSSVSVPDSLGIGGGLGLP